MTLGKICVNFFFHKPKIALKGVQGTGTPTLNTMRRKNGRALAHRHKQSYPKQRNTKEHARNKKHVCVK